MIQKIVGLIPDNLKNNALYSFLREKYITKQMRKVFHLYCDYETLMRKYNLNTNKRIFIVGTGPSLCSTRLDLLENEPVMGVNTLFNTVKCTYYVVADSVVFAKYWKKILAIDCPLFLASTAGLEYLVHNRKYNKIMRLHPVHPIRGLKFDTVILSCLWLAALMDFKEIYLVGCDFDFSGKYEHFDGSKVTTKTMAYITGDYTKTFKAFEIFIECQSR